MKVVPDSKPQITRDDTAKIAHHFLGADLPPVVLVGVRGYFSKTMGPTEGNDINLYDDAMLVLGPEFYTYNFNTDPSFANKSLATLNTGVYRFYKGRHHNRYNALRSYPEGVKLPCTRDGKPSMCGLINIHHGGMNLANTKDGVTWSAGCQTLPPTQWDEFITRVYSLMTKNNMSTITYILLTNEEMKAILAS